MSTAMTMLKRTIFSLCMLVLAGTARAEAFLKQAPESGCNASMSCAVQTGSMSKADSPPAVQHTPVPPLAACANADPIRNAKTAIKSCEAAARARDGSIRGRAMAMLMLGYAYAHDYEHVDFSQPPDEWKAMTAWKGALAVDPSFIDPLLAMSNIYSGSGRFKQAVDVLRQAERVTPDDWRVYARLSAAYLAARIFPAAREAAEKAVKLARDRAEPHVLLGQALLMHDRFGDAITEFQLAVGAARPTLDRQLYLFPDQNAWTELANAYFQNEQPALAAWAMTKFMEGVDPRFRNYADFTQRAEYYERAGLHAKAADDWAEAIKLAPPHLLKEYTSKRSVLLAKLSPERPKAVADLRTLMQRGELATTLKVQVFLKNQGYGDVEINGKYDGPTQRALEDCFNSQSCSQSVGQAI
jgi:tetratricopeptide (TPR) repeat protein